MADWEGPSLDRLVGRADTLAGSWAARARLSTTLGQERAILRLFGVHGLDASGQPLAGQVVDRYMGSGRRRLASGIALPFAMALLEYDLGPQELALDVASGAIDLGMEAELLLESDRRATAEQEAGRLAEAAIDRIDANRTARRELIALIGDTPRPWVGGSLSETAVDAALREAAALVVAPDLARGFPSDPATRCGRALAMQLLAVMLARRSGLADEQVIVDSLPSWIWDEPNPTVQAIAAVAVRRAALPGHHLAFREPEQAGHE